MDARAWHRACTTPTPPEPQHLTAASWERLSSSRRAAHIADLGRWLHTIHLDTEQAATATRRMTEIVDENTQTPPGAKLIAAVTGVNTVGKSTVVRRWAADRYRDSITGADTTEFGVPVWQPQPYLEADLCPVVWVNLQSAVMVKGLNSQILDFFGLPARGVAHRLSTVAVQALARHGTQILVIDDTQLLRTNWKGSQDVLDHIKYLNTELGEFDATLVLVGTGLADSAITADPQITGRLELTELVPLDITTESAQHAWQRVLHRLETLVLPHLPRAQAGVLTTEFAGPIWKRCQGYLGDTSRLIRTATLDAVKDGTLAITARHLSAVRLSDRAHHGEQQITRRRRTADRP